MRYIERAVATVFMLSVTSAVKSVREQLYWTRSIVISNNAGADHPLCLQRNATSPASCRTIGYVFNHILLSNREIILQGDHIINHTLTVCDVDGLTIRSGDNTNSTIYCRQPATSNDTGAGLVFVSVSNLSISNVVFEGCGTLQLSTIVQNNGNVKQRSAVYIINSTNIRFNEINFLKNIGRRLSMYDVSGDVHIEKCKFHKNAVYT